MRDMGPILTNKKNLVLFAREVLFATFESGDLDGGKIQDLALKLGLLVEEPYDSEKHGEEWLAQLNIGDPFYVYTNLLTLPKAPARQNYLA